MPTTAIHTADDQKIKGVTPLGDDKYRVRCFRGGKRMSAVVVSLQKAKATRVLMEAGAYVANQDKPKLSLTGKTKAPSKQIPLATALNVAWHASWSGDRTGQTSFRNAERFAEFAGDDLLVSDVSSELLRQFADDLAKKDDLGPHSVKRILASISSMLTACNDRGHMVDAEGRAVPLPSIPKIKADDNARQLVLTAQQVEQCIDVLQAKDLNAYADAVIVLAFAGWRSSELGNLTKRSLGVTLSGGLTITHEGTKAGHRALTVPVHKRASAVLLTRSRGLDGDAPLFPEAKSAGWLNYQWNRVVRPALFPDVESWQHKECVPYVLRHTFATWLHKEDVPLATISKLMGHKSVQTTMRYVKVSVESMEEAVAAIEDKAA